MISVLTGGCEQSDPRELAFPENATAVLEARAAQELIQLYAEALRNEDIDRLQELLVTASAAATGLPSEAATMSANTLREAISNAFQALTFTEVQILDLALSLDDSPPSATFWEARSVEDRTDLEQQTQLSRPTFQLVRQSSSLDLSNTSIQLAAASGITPVVVVAMPGQVRAGQETVVDVRLTAETVVIDRLDLSMLNPDRASDGDNCRDLPGTPIATQAIEPTHFQGRFTPPSAPGGLALCVRIGVAGQTLAFRHPYRVQAIDVVIEKLQDPIEPDNPVFSAFYCSVGAAPTGIVWFGGRGDLPEINLLQVDLSFIRVRPDGSIDRDFSFLLPLDLEGLREDPDEQLQLTDACVNDIVVDRANRHHLIFSVQLTETGNAPEGVINASFVPLREINSLCQTVNFVAPDYPLQVVNPATNTLVPSIASRGAASDDPNEIWIFGSDGGVARVRDDCSLSNALANVEYHSLINRELFPQLLTNSISALLQASDGAIWLGGFLGLQRLQDGQFTNLPFDRPPILVGEQLDSLERLFQAAAAAIFEARPLTSVSVGRASFVDAFGQALVKEDIIFSLVEDHLGRVWAATLGGGIRRLENCGGIWRDTLHLTRTTIFRHPCGGERSSVPASGEMALGGNIVSALDIEPDGTLWAVTREGLSRVDDDSGVLRIANFSALDGFDARARDVSVGPDGTVWVATQAGAYRLRQADSDLASTSH